MKNADKLLGFKTRTKDVCCHNCARRSPNVIRWAKRSHNRRERRQVKELCRRTKNETYRGLYVP